MKNNVISEYDQREASLRIMIHSYDDLIAEGRLNDDFLACLLEAYKEVENTEKEKYQKSLTVLKRLREVIRKNKKEYELPIKQIQIYSEVPAKSHSELIKSILVKSIGTEAEISRTSADRWELFEDLAVGADLLIDISALTTGLTRYVSSGEIKEGIAGFGYLAVVGMGLLVVYFILRIFGEEPCKKKVKYLTHILRTPITLHRKIEL
jgi:hypothetical protein